MPVSSECRRRYYVDARVQGALLRQFMRCWVYSSVIFTLTVLVYRIAPLWFSGSDQLLRKIWFNLSPYVIASAVILPILAYNVIRFSNRFAGPMLRFRRTLQQIADGETPPALRLREGDFWSDVANDINKITTRLGQASASPSEEGLEPSVQ